MATKEEAKVKKATICFCLRDGNVLLAMKRQSFGSGKWNGYGGKVDEGESPRAAVIRELREESGLVAHEDDLMQVGRIKFFFEDEPKFECHVYVLHAWEGEPVDSDEMHDARWFPVSTLPFAQMWPADAVWIPLILAGECIDAKVVYSADGTSLEKFSYRKATFD